MKPLVRKCLLVLFIFSSVSCSDVTPQISRGLQDATATPEPFFVKVEKTKDALDDGILSIEIEEKDAKCHRINDSIFINLVFANLTNQPLVLQSRFVASERRFGTDGDILVWLNTQDGTPLLTPRDAFTDGFCGPTSSPLKYQTLNESSKFEIELNYKFPSALSNGNQAEYNFSTPGPGKYFIRIIYQNLVPSQVDEWSGIIASNQIEVCIIE